MKQLALPLTPSLDAVREELEQARAQLAGMAHRGAVWPDGVLEKVSLQMRIRRLERQLECYQKSEVVG